MAKSHAKKPIANLPQVVKLIAELFSAVLGLVVMGAWHLRLTALIQVLPGSPPIRYNTAVAFLLSGLALRALAKGWRRLAGGLSVLVALIGGLTLAQYIFEVDLGIDQLLMQDYLSNKLYPPGSVPSHGLSQPIQQFFITLKRPLPGRPSPNTAFGFTLVGIAILCLSWIRGRRRGKARTLAEAIAGILAAGVIGMSAIALLGYLSGLDTAYSWRYLTGVAIPTAFGLLILGLSLFILSLDDRQFEHLPQWLALSAGFGVLTATLFLWQALESWRHNMSPQQSSLKVEVELLLHPTANILLLEGVLLALLVMLAVSFAQLAYRHATKLRGTNRELEQSNLLLQNSQLRLQGILEIASDAIISVDANQQITLFNQGAEKIFGYTAQEVLGQRLDLLLPERFATLHRQHVTDFSQTTIKARKMRERSEVFGRRKDGTEFPAEASISQLQLGSEKVFTAFVRDITEHKRAELALRQSQEHLQYLLRSSPAVIFSAKPDGDYGATYISENVSKVLGYEAWEFLADSGFWVNHTHPEDIDSVFANLPQLFEQEVYSHEYRFLHADGTYHWLRAEMKLVKDEVGKPTEVVGYLVDISDAYGQAALRQQAEEELRESLHFLRKLTDAAPQIFYLFEISQGTTRYINNKSTEILGYSPNEICRAEPQWLIDHFHPDDQYLCHDLPNRFINLSDNEVLSTEYRFRHKNGEWRWLNTREVVFARDANGVPTQILGSVQDISDRIQAEQTLRESEERFRNAFDYAAIGMALVATDGRWLKVNRALCEITGYSEQELLATTFQAITHPDDLDADLAYVNQLLTGEIHSYQREKRYFHKQGHIVWIFLSGSLVRDHQDQPLYFISQIQDISERKRAEESVQESEKRLQLALEGSGDGLWDWNIVTKEVYFSPRYLEMLGYEVGELPGDLSTWERLVHPDDKLWVREILDAHLKDSSFPYAFEYRVQTKSGEWKWVANYGKVVLRDRNGLPLRMSGTHKDISDRKQIELEIIRNRNLKEAIFNESADAIFLVDPETLLTLDCNRRAVELFEATSKDELIGISGTTLQRQPFTFEELTAIAQEVNTTGVWSREIEYVTKQGKLFWGNLASRQINVAGKVMNLVRLSDITERKLAEKELKLQAVIARNMAEGICLVRAADGVIVYANPKFERMFGYEEGGLNGKHVSIVNYEDEHISAQEVNLAIRREVMQHGEATYEVHNVKKDGTPFWCRATASIFDHPEYGTVLVAVQQDITERKLAEERIKASLKEKEVLLKEIHHRVKNNLQIVDSLLQMQSRRIKDKQAVEILRDSQNRIASIALVHEKLYRSEDLANIDFAQYIPDLNTHLFDTYNVSSDTVTLTIQVAPISLEIDTAIPCGLIINELVSNSLKYAFTENRQGEIMVEFYRSSDRTMTLIVRDNGIGIPEEFDIETTQSLGLTLVQGLVEQLEGTMELDRTQGTEFRITFSGGRT